MSRCFRRVILGAAVIVGTSASAQPYPTDTTTSSERFVAAASDTYAVDEADAEVVEFPRDANEAPQITAAPHETQERADDPYADDRQIAAATPQCTEYQEAVVARGETQAAHGTVCQQADGSWRIVSAPSIDARGEVETADRARPASRTAQSYCREYQQTVVANGRERLAYGEACQQTDGSWRVVTPPSMDVASAERRADYQPQPRHITSASMRAQQRFETRREEHPYAERSYAYRPRHSPLYNLFFGWLD